MQKCRTSLKPWHPTISPHDPRIINSLTNRYHNVKWKLFNTVLTTDCWRLAMKSTCTVCWLRRTTVTQRLLRLWWSRWPQGRQPFEQYSTTYPLKAYHIHPSHGHANVNCIRRKTGALSCAIELLDTILRHLRVLWSYRVVRHVRIWRHATTKSYLSLPEAEQWGIAYLWHSKELRERAWRRSWRNPHTKRVLRLLSLQYRISAEIRLEP